MQFCSVICTCRRAQTQAHSPTVTQLSVSGRETYVEADHILDVALGGHLYIVEAALLGLRVPSLIIACSLPPALGKGKDINQLGR